MCELLNKVKENTGLNANQIAKEIKVSPELVSRWNLNKSEPNGENTLKLAKLANLNIDEALILVTNNARRKAPEPTSVAGSLYIMSNWILAKVERMMFFVNNIYAN